MGSRHGSRRRVYALFVLLAAILMIATNSALAKDDTPPAAESEAAHAHARAAVTLALPPRATVEAASPDCAQLNDPEALAALGGAAELWLRHACEQPAERASSPLPAQSAAATAAQALSPDAPVNDRNLDSGTALTQSTTSSAISGKTGAICSAYIDSFHGTTEGLGYMGFSRSTDGGATFEDRKALDSTVINYGNPSMVWRKSDGYFYLTALPGGSDGIGVWRSIDDCQSFQFYAYTHTDTLDATVDDMEILAVDNTPASPFYGRMYVVWKGESGQIQFTYSDDGAKWFAGGIALTGLNEFGKTAQTPWVAVAPNGDVYVTWVVLTAASDAQTHTYDIEVAASTNGGATFAARPSPLQGALAPHDTANSACKENAWDSVTLPALLGNIRYYPPPPQIAVGADGVIHMVYSYDPDGADTGDVVDVFYRQSTDQGQTWSAELRLNDDGGSNDQFFPSISVSGQGRVVAAWYDRRNDPDNYLFEVFARASYDNGVTWAASEKVSDAQSPVVIDDEIALCYHGFYDQQFQDEGHAYLFWSDDREGDADVFAEKISFQPNFRLTAPASVNVCAASSATIAVDLRAVSGYAKPVTLGVTGVPAGYKASFGTNPVTPSASSTLKLALNGTPAAGTYTMTVSATGATAAHTSKVALNVFSGNPAAPALTAPANAATGVPALPTFTWTGANAAAYKVEVAADAGFTKIVLSETTRQTSLTPNVYLDPGKSYWWRVTAQNPCGGKTSSAGKFTTVSAKRVLLIDGDNNEPDVLSYYTEPLDALGISYDVWDVATHGEPGEANLAAYGQAVWFTGGSYTAPTAAAEQQFASWLQHDACLAVSAQDAFSAVTPFRSQFLGLRGVVGPVPAYTEVSGAWVVFGALGPYTLTPPFNANPKSLYTNGLAQPAFASPDPFTAGAMVYTNDIKSTFWGFPLEGISALTGRQEVLGAFVNWCEKGVAFGSVSGVVTDGDTGGDLQSAQISFDDGARRFTLTSDHTGHYSGDLPVGTYTATASLPHYAAVAKSGVKITAGAGVKLDFALFGSTLSVSPTTVSQSVEIASTADVPLTLSASGPLPVTADAAVYTTLDDRIYGIYASYAPRPVFGYLRKDGKTITKLSDFELGGSPGGDFFGDDFSTVYAIADDGDYDHSNDQLVALDTATGAARVIATIPAIENGQYLSMAYDPVTEKMYLAGMDVNLWGWPKSEFLTTVDVHTGKFGDAVQLITTSPGEPSALAFDDEGRLFLHDTWNGALVQVDLNTHAAATIGPLDAATDINSGMDWDPVTRQMYLTTWTSSRGGELRIVDLTTGDTAFVSKLGSVDPGKPEETAFLWIAFASERVDWAAVSPSHISVPANGSAALTLTLDTRRLSQLGELQARVGFSGSHVAPANLHTSVAMRVVCSDCGVLTGSVSDAWTGQPLAANVRITDAGGFDILLKGSSYKAAVRPGVYTITASAPGYLDRAVDVNAATGVTTTTDLALLPRAGKLEYSPDRVNVIAQIGDVITKQVTVSNTGSVPMTFRLHLDNQDMPIAIAGQARQQINHEAAPRSTDAALDIRAYGLNTDGVKGALAWFDLADPTNLEVSPILHPHGSMVAGDFFGDDSSTLYAFEESKLIALDTTSGAKTVVGALPLISPYSQYDSMSYDPVSQQMYILYGFSLDTPRSLYKVDIKTAKTTLVGAINDASVGLIQAIEFDDSGTLYGIDFGNNLLVKIDPTTMAVSVVGGLGFDAGANYQGLSYDSASNQLYLSANEGNNYPFTSQLYAINTQTGKATPLGTIGSNSPGSAASTLSGLAIASEAQDWVDAPKDQFEVAAGESVTLDLVFDTRSLHRTGLYTSDLTFSGDFINDVAPLPVSLDLGCDGCATLKGSIFDKADNAPLRANLRIVSENGFDVALNNRSTYDLTVQPGDYEFTVERSGYISQEKTVTAAANTATTTDFALVARNVDIAIDPASLTVSTPVGGASTYTFTVTNRGNTDFAYQMRDRAFGNDPAASVPLTSCGEPDAFGYACLDSHQTDGPAYRWVDISKTGASLALDGANDFYFPIDLPFDFSFYGEAHRQIAVSSYGQIYFEDKVADPSWGGAQPLPADMGDGVNTFIAPMWDTSFAYDQAIANPNLAEPGVTYEIQGIAPYRRLVISWENIPTNTPDWTLAQINFQAILFEGSNNILFQYGKMDGISGEKATVGIQGDASTATQFSHQTDALSDDMAVCFVHPDATLGMCDLDYPADAGWMSQAPASGALAAGASMTVEVTFDATDLELGQLEGEIYFGGAWNTPLVVPVTMNVVSVTWSPDQTKRAAPGGAVTYEVNLTNVGQVADIYDLQVETRWPAKLSYAVNGAQVNEAQVNGVSGAGGNIGLWVALNPAETATLFVTVSVPAVAAGGQDALALTAASRQFPLGIDTIHLTTVANHQQFLPMISR